MNLECVKILPLLRVLIINPLTTAANLYALKILQGMVFGMEQLIDLTLLVYSNEMEDGLALRRNLERTAVMCLGSISVTTDIPKITDHDVFIVFTTFKNPNQFDLKTADEPDSFDSIYLLLKIATNMIIPKKTPEQIEKEQREKERLLRKNKPIPITRKPIFMADGLVALDILYNFSTNVPSDCFFCPSPVPAIATSILGDHLKVMCTDLNKVHVFAADDENLYVEFETPLLKTDVTNQDPDATCEWDLVSRDKVKDLNQDYLSFNSAWMKTDFLEKVKFTVKHNVYGPLFKSFRMTKALKEVWKPRRHPEKAPFYRAVGIISDGSMETIKGLSYVFPCLFYPDTYKVNHHFSDSYHIKAEMKKFNEISKKRYNELIPYCQKFIQQNIIKQKFIHADSGTSFDVTRTDIETGRSSTVGGYMW